MLAVLFFVLEAQHRLTGPFPFFAGWGDIINRTRCGPLAFLAAGRWRESSTAPLRLFAWNCSASRISCWRSSSA